MSEIQAIALTGATLITWVCVGGLTKIGNADNTTRFVFVAGWVLVLVAIWLEALT